MRILIVLIGFITCSGALSPQWGFYAHRMLNKYAVYTLPSELIEYYKKNIQYISDHAIDPDKRRYAVRQEAIRHYIDMDHWGDSAWHKLPRNYYAVILDYLQIYSVFNDDTTLVFHNIPGRDSLIFTQKIKENHTVYSDGILKKKILPKIMDAYHNDYDPDEWITDPAILENWIVWTGGKNNLLLVDSFSRHGILPYHLMQNYQRLVQAFKSLNHDAILKLSADIGHYIGDAHVPLHTTKNYNGQLTNQDGIHAFWESRLPELFAEVEFDLVVGPARYIENLQSFFWDCILESYNGVELVFNAEKLISKNTPEDEQYCYENRLNQLTKIQCYDYSKKYLNALDYQVEDRFRECILAIGSVWMSAWVDAGQPNLMNNKSDGNPVWNDSLNLQSNRKFNVREHE